MAKLHRLSFLMAVVIVAFIAMMSSVAFAKDEEPETKYQYGVMIDAGSSGTRTFIYSWQHREMDADSDKISPLSRPITQEGWSKKVNTPIASFEENPDEVGSLLAQGVEFAKTTLTTLKVTNFTQVPIFLGATAGVRMMKAPKRNELFKVIRKFYHQTPFEFKNHYAKVLSGEEEGFFGFLAVNYLTGKLYPHPHPTPTPTDQLYEEKDQVPLEGALDMGGASTQITFDTRGDDIMEGYFEYSTPDENRYATYTHSFLQFGMNQWWERLNNLATKGKLQDEVIEMKCLGAGFEYRWTNTESQIDYRVIGTGTVGGHWDKCYEENKTLLLRGVTCLTDSCSINGVYQPKLPPNTILYAFSGFVSMISSYKTDWDPTKAYPIDVFEELGKSLCSMSKAELEKTYPKAATEFLPRACGAFAYFFTLTKDAYRFPTATPVLKFAKEVNKTEVSWALGRMIYEVNLRNYDRILPHVPTPPGTITFWVAIAVLMLAIACLLLLLLSTWSKMTQANQPKQSELLSDVSTNDGGYV